MKKNRTLFSIIHMIMLVVICSTIFFAGCDDEEPDNCLAPTELGLTDIGTELELDTFNNTSFIEVSSATLTYGWMPSIIAEGYQFILYINGVTVDTQFTVNPVVNVEMSPLIQDGSTVTAEVKTICIDNTESEPITDSFVAACPAPTELGLTDISTVNFTSLTYEWTPPAINVLGYEFILYINGGAVDTQFVQNLQNPSANFTSPVLLEVDDVVEATVQTICTSGTESDEIVDTFTYRGGAAAVAVVYWPPQGGPDFNSLCSTNCYIKFGESGVICGDFIEFNREKWYYYTIIDFCGDCLENSCGAEEFVECLNTKDKSVFISDNPC